MFEVVVIPPAQFQNNWNVREFKYLCKSAQIPSSTITTVSVGLPAGANLKLPGSRIFEPWTTKVINDGQMKIRGFMEVWHDAIIGTENQLSDTYLNLLFGNVQVRQLGKDAEIIRTYSLEHCYPTILSAQQLAYETRNTISEFDITWNYHYFRASNTDNTTMFGE